jgi:hypothetical protein
MYLVTTAGTTMRNTMNGTEKLDDDVAEVQAVGGVAGWLMQAAQWWKQRGLRERRRTAKRQMFIVESIQLGPKQRVVLLKCGGDRFLVGTGAEGIQSIVRVGAVPLTGELPVVTGGDERWG